VGSAHEALITANDQNVVELRRGTGCLQRPHAGGEQKATQTVNCSQDADSDQEPDPPGSKSTWLERLPVRGLASDISDVGVVARPARHGLSQFRVLGLWWHSL